MSSLGHRNSFACKNVRNIEELEVQEDSELS